MFFTFDVNAGGEINFGDHWFDINLVWFPGNTEKQNQILHGEKYCTLLCGQNSSVTKHFGSSMNWELWWYKQIRITTKWLESILLKLFHKFWIMTRFHTMLHKLPCGEDTTNIWLKSSSWLVKLTQSSFVYFGLHADEMLWGDLMQQNPES